MSSLPQLRVVPDRPVAMGSTSITAAVARSRPPDPSLAAINDEVTDLRNALFTLEDLAHRALRPGEAAVTVALQSAAHQLGEVQRLLGDAS